MPAMGTKKKLKPLALSQQTQDLLRLEHQYTAGGFKPLPAFIIEGKGCKVWVGHRCIDCRK